METFARECIYLGKAFECSTSVWISLRDFSFLMNRLKSNSFKTESKISWRNCFEKLKQHQRLWHVKSELWLLHPWICKHVIIFSTWGIGLIRSLLWLLNTVWCTGDSPQNTAEKNQHNSHLYWIFMVCTTQFSAND